MRDLILRWMVVIAVMIGAGAAPIRAASLPPLRRVNAPYFGNGIVLAQTAVFWLGKVTPYENYADVRLGYSPNILMAHVAIMDRLLWYNTNPTTSALTNWDSATLYLNKSGAVGTSLADAYRFDGQVNDGEGRTAWQAAYTWNGTRWITATTTFTTESSISWESVTVGGFNNNRNNRGYFMRFRIPYTSLGLAGPPPAGTVWGLAVVVHDRDVAPTGAMQPDKLWPETANLATPATWGELYFGMPVYTPQVASPKGTVTIRNGLNEVAVTEGAAGGGSTCGGDLTNYWMQWGVNVSNSPYYFNVQNLFISEWPCFSKYYTTFPLGGVPANKVVISATLAVNQFGNAGDPADQPVRSYIQLLTVGEDWIPDTLNWNNAPLGRENVAMTAVDPLNGAPAVWRTWDVSRAVAEAYGAGEPLRLAFYAADDAFHSGRYFRPSGYPDEDFRPTLTVRWGDPLAAIHKSVKPPYPVDGQLLTYTLDFLGSGTTLTMTDSLPPEVGAPGSVVVQGGGTWSYDVGLHQVTWKGSPSVGQPVTVTIPVVVTEGASRLVRNTALLVDALGNQSTGMAESIINAHLLWQPLIRR